MGGRASSFINPDTAELVDNCQHILMKCCTQLLDFYEKLGVKQYIHWFDKFHFIDRSNQISEIYSSPLPAPFHLFPSLLKFKALGWRDKIGIIYGMFCILSQDETLHTELEKITIDQWLRNHGQTDKAINTFWKPILVSALNEKIEVSSAKYAFKLFRIGFLQSREAYEMGIPSIRLSELYSQPTVNFLHRYQGEVIFKKSVAKIKISNNHVSAIELIDGSEITGDYYISAVTFDILCNLIPEDVISHYGYFTNLEQLNVSPITGIHFWFDRMITELDHLVIPNRTIQWMFNKTKNFQNSNSSLNNNENTYLGLVISASNDLMSLGREEIIKIALDEVHEIFPKSKEAKLIKSIVIKEPKATFSPSPGCDQIRPIPESPITNLFLAGDWTKTDWPGTMESAVISGYRCADKIIERN